MELYCQVNRWIVYLLTKELASAARSALSPVAASTRPSAPHLLQFKGYICVHPSWWSVWQLQP